MSKTTPRKKFNPNTLAAQFNRVSFGEVIKPIFRKFIEPCIRQLNPVHGETRKDFLHLWFGVNERVIYCVKAKKGFKLPGQVRDPNTRFLINPSSEQRAQDKGSQFWVRFNREYPDLVEVQIDESEVVFEMTLSQWEGIKGNLLHVG